MEFNRLPLIVQLKIFSFLPASDVLKFRRVCKQWMALINSEFKLKTLRCSRPLKFLKKDNGYWDFYFKSTKTFSEHIRNDPRFSGVKYLDALLFLRNDFEIEDLQDAFDFLNTFEFLEKTKFTCYPLNYPSDNDQAVERKQLAVRLNRLKEACFRWKDYSSIVSVVLNLPSLLCLQLDSLEGVTIEHPGQLRVLMTGSLFKGIDYSGFKNLEKICTNASDIHLISASFIEKLPSLKELHLDNFYHHFDACLLNPPLTHQTRQTSPRIFYYGFEISLREITLDRSRQWPNLCDYFRESTEENDEFIIRNRYRSSDNNQFVESIRFNQMVNELDDSELFGLIPQKFPKIKRLDLNGRIVDECRLLKFMGQFKISHLSLERTCLPKSFSRKLAENCPFIQALEIGTEPTMSILSGDFDFVFNFTKLYSIRFKDCPLSLNFVARALKELEHISIEFNQPEQSDFWFRPDYSDRDHMRITSSVPRSGFFSTKISAKDALKFVNSWTKQLSADGRYVCPKSFHNLLLAHFKRTPPKDIFWYTYWGVIVFTMSLGFSFMLGNLNISADFSIFDPSNIWI